MQQGSPSPLTQLTWQTSLVDEQVFGLLDHLPGCGAIYDRTTGPRMRPDCVDNPDILTPAVGFVGSPPAGSCALSGGASTVATSNGYAWQQCLGYIDARPLSVNVDGGANTVDACLKQCAAAGLAVCGLEYGGQVRPSL